MGEHQTPRAGLKARTLAFLAAAAAGALALGASIEARTTPARTSWWRFKPRGRTFVMPKHSSCRTETGRGAGARIARQIARFQLQRENGLVRGSDLYRHVEAFGRTRIFISLAARRGQAQASAIYEQRHIDRALEERVIDTRVLRGEVKWR